MGVIPGINLFLFEWLLWIENSGIVADEAIEERMIKERRFGEGT